MEGFETGEVVRPFIVTAGRTRPVMNQNLNVETLVSAPSAALSAPLAFERRRIVELCQYPHSVAELSALLRTPLGVIRVLVAELSAGRHVVVHHDVQPEATYDTLERVLQGLRRL